MTEPFNRASVARSTIWTVLDFTLERAANFVIIAILARLLTPAEFGTVALLAVFIALATVLADSGFSQALIQRKNLDEDDTSTAFWINMALAAALCLLLVGGAPLIAAFFGQPALVPLTRILAVGVIFGALGTVQRALLLRALQYRRLMAIRITATIVSGILAVTLALQGFGVFSLAWQACALAFVTSAMLWATSAWQPKAIFRRDAAKRLFGFGGYMLASSILETIYSRAYTLFIGKLSSPMVLGLYGRADASLSLVQGLVTYPLNQIAFPTLSRVNHDRDMMRDGMRQALRTSMLLNVPAMLGLATVAGPFIRTAYGDQWSGAVPFLQILCLGGILMPVHILNLQALMAIGRSDLFFWLEIGKKAVGIAILASGSYWGPIGIAWAVVIAGIVGAVFNTHFSKRLFGYGLGKQAGDVLPSAILGAGMAAAVHLALKFSPIASYPAIGQLALGSGLGFAIWAGFALAFDLAGARKLAGDLRMALSRK